MPRSDLMRSGLELRTTQIDAAVIARYHARDEANLAYHVMTVIGRMTEVPARRDSPYWPWFSAMDDCVARPHFVMFVDRIKFRTDLEDPYTRFVAFCNLCLAGSPIFPTPSKPPGGPTAGPDGEEVRSAGAALPDGPAGRVDGRAPATLTALVHGIGQPVITFTTATHGAISAPHGTATHEGRTATHGTATAPHGTATRGPGVS